MRKTLSLILTMLMCASVLADEDKQPEVFKKLPIREVTVFKDGHALLVHEGQLPSDADGNVKIDQLPQPVLGTFWPYSAEKDVKLRAVVAGMEDVLKTSQAANIPELIRANRGARVIVRENNNSYQATIVDTPQAKIEKEDATAPVVADYVQLLTFQGVRVVPIGSILEITFLDDFKREKEYDAKRGVMTMHLDWPGQPGQNAAVGMMYVQEGLRWIPSYKVDIDGQGGAKVKMQATLVNDLADMEDVTLNLVIGVPRFAFAGQTDPISLAETIARVEHASHRDSRRYLSNAIMTQMVSADMPMMPGSPAPLPKVQGGETNEDLFVYTVEHVTLKKGQRMVLPVKEFSLAYQDVYTLDLAISPPPEAWQHFSTEQITEVARMSAMPKVMHQLRLHNTSDAPLTTAPALIMKNGKVLAQGMMKYTSIKATCDLAVTQAVNIKVKKTDREISRNLKAAEWRNHWYCQIDLTGEILLHNYSDKSIELEVTRSVLGAVDECSDDGIKKMINVFEDPSYLDSSNRPGWWGWYRWPWWWYRFNGIGQIEWKITLEPDKSKELNYKWHYFWE